MGSTLSGEKTKEGEKMKIALAIITMVIGLLFAFSESPTPTMIPNFLGAIAFLMSGVVLGNCIYRGLK